MKVITVKVNLKDEKEAMQKISLSFSKHDASVMDIIESLSEMYPYLHKFFFQANGDLNENLAITSSNGNQLPLDSILSDKIIVNINVNSF